MNKTELSKHMRSFLIGLRENAALSQGDVSKRSGMSEGKLILDQKTVSRIENSPLDGDVYKIAAYMSAIGNNLDVYSKEMQSAIQKNRGKGMEQVTKSRSVSIIDDTMLKVEKAKQMLNQFDHGYIDGLELETALEQSVSNLEGLKRKPVIGFFGHYDSGKSTLINTIINSEFLPVKYQPATSIVNMLVHKDDKPHFLTGEVALFSKGFLPHMIHDEEKVKEFLIEEGGKEVLEKYGTHDWDELTMNEDAYISVSYLNSPILNRVWLLDTPGNLNEAETQDTDFAVSGVELVDGVVFLSQHSGYMNGPSVSFLTDIIRKRVPSSKQHVLDHIMFVKTHCHSGMSTDEIKSVELLAMKRIHKHVETTVFSSWKADGFIDETPTAQMLADNSYSFWRETDSLRLDTLSAIDKMSFFLMENQDVLVRQRVLDVENSIVNTIKAGVAKLESFKKSGEERLKEVQEQDARFRKESISLIRQFEEMISSTHQTEQSCQDELKMYYNSLTNDANIESLINDNFDDKKDAEQGIGGIISQLLSTKLERTLKSNSTIFNNQIDHLLVSWQSIAPQTNTTNTDVDIDGLQIDGFDARSAFVGGLAGVGSLGAMALYVSGIASNLGAYILVGKAAGVLTSLGLATSVTSVTSFVAAIGGPITIGVVIASVIGYAVYRLFGGKWQSSLAKKIKEVLDKNSPLDKVKEVISKYWKATREATQACLAELQNETDKHIEKMYEEANLDFNLDELETCIKEVDSINVVFK
jgi:hypothetical protein